MPETLTYNQKYYKDNASKVRARSLAYYGALKLDPERLEARRARARASYAKNIVANRARKAAWNKRREIVEYKCKVGQTPRYKFASYKSSATSRGLEFSISFENFMANFWMSPCRYCGAEIKTVGIDRVDNFLGYTDANSVPCCRRCNRGKSNLPPKEFIEWCSEVARRGGMP